MTTKTPPANLASIFGSGGPASTLHFLVHPGLPEIAREAERRGWLAKGFTTLSVTWIELRWTSDGWKTRHAVSSDDVPCPVMNGVFQLRDCPSGTEVEFALHVGLACHAPHDSAGARDVGEVWLNNQSRNYRQTTR